MTMPHDEMIRVAAGGALRLVRSKRLPAVWSLCLGLTILRCALPAESEPVDLPASSEDVGEFREALLGELLPDAPSLMRDVSLVQSARYSRPTLPPLRTTADGRIGINMKLGSVQTFLCRPS
jgi:hypothetical protein